MRLKPHEIENIYEYINNVLCTDLSIAIDEEKESDTFKTLVLEKINQFEKDLENFIEYVEFIIPTIDYEDRNNLSLSMTLHDIGFYLKYDKDKFEIITDLVWQKLYVNDDGTYDKDKLKISIENNICDELRLQNGYNKQNLIGTKLYALLSTLESFNEDNPIDLEKLLAFARQKINVKEIALAKNAWETESV